MKTICQTVLIACLGFGGALLTAESAAGGTMELLPPEIGVGWCNGWVADWKRDVPGLVVEDSRTPLSNGLVKVRRRWTWTGRTPLYEVTLSVRFRVRGETAALKPFLPGVLLYGNPSNKGRKDGRVPVYAGEPGEFGFFEEHRLSMPFALLENAKTREFAALHVLPSRVRGAVCDDLWWTAGVEAVDNGADLVLLSGPVGYNRRRSVSKANMSHAVVRDKTYLTLYPGQVIDKIFWIQTGTACDEQFGFEQAMAVSLDIYRPYETHRYAPFSEIVKRKRDYALTRWTDVNGRCGFDMWDARLGRRTLVLGWCGAGATCGYALPVLDYDRADWDKAQRSLDFISDAFGATVRDDGLFHVGCHLPAGNTWGGDPVSCGQALYSIVKAIRFTETSGRGRLNPAKWRAFAEKSTTALARTILADGWTEPRSTSAGFLIAPLVLASELFGRRECLDAAQKMAAVFARDYVGYAKVYWGGTLDARCEDKEGAFAAFQGYSALLRHAVKTKDAAAEKKYARLARHAMNNMLTYTVIWDIAFPPGRLSDHGFKTTGWTVVSPQNQHIDAFGVLTTPDIWRMGAYLGDERLKKLAAVMYRSCFQLTSESGALGEGVQHSYHDMPENSLGGNLDTFAQRGGYKEHWTVFWLTAHFLNAAAEFREMGVEL